MNKIIKSLKKCAINNTLGLAYSIPLFAFASALAVFLKDALSIYLILVVIGINIGWVWGLWFQWHMAKNGGKVFTDDWTQD